MNDAKQEEYGRLRLDVADVIALLESTGGCERCAAAAKYLRRALLSQPQGTNPFTV